MAREVDRRISEDERMADEIEQLRTALESSLEENGRLIEDRDRLRDRVAMLARELQAASVAYGQRVPSASPSTDALSADEATAAEKHSQTEEELRVAFEELQVLAEELELANNGLIRANEDLESRVADRTREIAATSAELRRTELRFRTMVEGMPQLVWRAVDRGDWTWSSPQWADFTGQSLEESLGMGWLDAFHPDDHDTARLAWADAEAWGELAFEGRIRRAAEDRYRHFQTRARAVRGADGRILEWLGTATDVDDILNLQERQAVLVGELQHRTRNLMAVVQSVTLRTIRGSRSLDEFRRNIDARMQALARVQGVLSRRDMGARVTFDTLLREELSAHVALDAKGKGTQVSIAGPSGIPLQSSLVQTFALAIHELATNAVKYGALSTPDGHLAVRWEELRRDGEPPRMRVDWRENGVANMPDPAAPPRGGGYGRELIERALPYQLGARTRYRFLPDGVHCTIEVDIPDSEGAAEAIHG
jgi:PAS domain S-box-containing protein